MERRSVTCATCGTGLPSSNADAGVEREPCPTCGGTSISVAVSISSSVTLKTSVSTAARTANQAAARRRALEDGLTKTEAAVDAGSVSEAQAAVKTALEAIHELNDCLARNEWTQIGWTTDELGLWRAHIGARNAAHHTSSGVVVLTSPASRDERLCWDIDSAAIGSLRSAAQAAEYRARLDGQAVLPSLRKLVSRVAAAMS